MSRTSSQSSRRNGWSLDDVQHIVLDGVSWELYEHLLKEIGNRPIRLTFDNGDLEIMSPLPEHEQAKKIIGRLIEMLTLELDIPMQAFGSTTFKRKRRKRGLEPDECYYIRSAHLLQGKRRFTAETLPPPDLAVEVDITSRSIERLPIYAALGVAEVWRYDGNTLECLVLQPDGSYQASRMSLAFPMLRPADLVSFIEMASTKDQTAVVKAFQRWLRRQPWAKPAKRRR